MGCCSSSATTALQPSDVVELYGLKNLSMNGSRATVVHWVDNESTSRNDGGRWLVELHVPDRKRIAVLPNNCRVVSRARPPQPQPQRKIAVGSHVIIVGTSSMNTSTGVVESWLDNSQTSTNDGGRWAVRLDSGGRVVALKPSNLKPFNLVSSSTATSTPATPRRVSSRAVPLISSVSSQPNREDYAAAGGTDAALGGAFSTAGRSNADVAPLVATAIAPGSGGSSVAAEALAQQVNVDEAEAYVEGVGPSASHGASGEEHSTPEWLAPATGEEHSTPEWLAPATGEEYSTPEWLAPATGEEYSTPEWLAPATGDDGLRATPDWLQSDS